TGPATPSLAQSAAPASAPAQPAKAAPAVPQATPAPQPAPAKPKPEEPKKPDEVQLRLDGWRSEIDQIAAGVQRDGQTDRRLAELRGRADAIRAAAEEIAQAESPRAAAIEARLKQLGPAPVAKEGEPEPVEADAVKTEREDQQKLLAEAQGRVKQAQLLQLKADEIAKAIAEKRRARFAKDMIERSRSVVDPSMWLEAVSSLPSIFSGLIYLLRDWFALLAGRGFETATAMGSIILLFLGALLAARRRLAQLTERDPEAAEPTTLVRAVKAAGIVLVNFAVPVLALLGVARALDVFELNPARVDLFISALVEGVASAAMVYGIALAILAPGKPQWRMAPVGDQTATRLLRLFVTLSIVHGFGVWFTRLLDVLAAPVATLILAFGLFAVADAVLVMLALRTAARSMAGDEETVEIAEAATVHRSSLWRWILPLGWILAIGATVGALAGYVALASFVTQQTIRTGFLLGALYILLVLADESIQATFHASSRFGMMMTRSMGMARETVEQIGVVLSGVVRLLLIAVAGLFILAPIGIDGQDVVSDAKIAFFGFRIGGLTFSLSAILTGIAFLGIGIAVTRGVQGWLDHRFLPRTRLDVGLKNSIRTSFGYVGTIISVALAFSVVGLDLQNLAIVAGALSVGVGFGLQSIVNNFVSGLILLAERPIKSGDLVEIGSDKGFVRKINVRSTEIETFDRASLIVPNSSLISGNVKNWMHRDLTGRCVVNVGVAYDADPERVKAILLDCAGEHEKVLKFPAPLVLFTNFGADALEFRLLCTIGAVTDVGVVESDLRFAVVTKLRAAGIEIPYAQRDVNIRNLDGLGELLGRVGLSAGGPATAEQTPKSS
ncbi:MAG: mechanosensitive ion channel family protein, partial [Phyllobacteriaceae bacterium]|nr:mechanosensitive ion channel family protein [Phyllobacteriaceae bacterium]